MMQRLLSYWQYTLKPWDIWKTKCQKNVKKKVLNIGFCALFPPFPNGAAAGSYYALRSLAQYDVSRGGNIAFYLLPLKNKIDKTLFSFMEQRFTTINDPELDVVISWCLGDDCATYVKRTAPQTKTIAWQTMHADPTMRRREQQTFDSVKQADLVLGVTAWAKECYSKQISHVDYVPFGIDTTLFHSTSKKDSSEKFTCLFVSRLHYLKGIIPLFDAIPFVLEKDPHIHFRIVGPLDAHSPYLDEIQQRLHQAKEKYPTHITIDTTWTAYKNMPALYHNADVLVFPSIFEGFGIPILEAMSSEVPCIVLDKKPMNELVVDGKTGYCLLPSKNAKNTETYHGYAFPDPKEIAQKILFLKKDQRKREAMGKKARERVLAEYDFSNVVPQLLGHCKNLADKKYRMK